MCLKHVMLSSVSKLFHIKIKIAGCWYMCITSSWKVASFFSLHWMGTTYRQVLKILTTYCLFRKLSKLLTSYYCNSYEELLLLRKNWEDWAWLFNIISHSENAFYFSGWFFQTFWLQTNTSFSHNDCHRYHVSHSSSNIDNNGCQTHYQCLSAPNVAWQDADYKNNNLKDNKWQTNADQPGSLGSCSSVSSDEVLTSVKEPQHVPPTS